MEEKRICINYSHFERNLISIHWLVFTPISNSSNIFPKYIVKDYCVYYILKIYVNDVLL